MSLKSYPGIKNKARNAMMRHGHNRFSKVFFSSFYKALSVEESTKRKPGDKHGLEGCIKTALTDAIDSFLLKNRSIRLYKSTIALPGFTRGKSPDFALTNDKKHYIIEQKSILRFNEFGEALAEGIVFHNEYGNKARFVTLFHYNHQPSEAYEPHTTVFGRKVIHKIFVLITDWDNDYNIDVVKDIMKDIKTWFK